MFTNMHLTATFRLQLTDNIKVNKIDIYANNTEMSRVKLEKKKNKQTM